MSEDQEDVDVPIEKDPRFVKNKAKLAKKVARVYLGAPVRAREFLDCVAVGNDSGWTCSGTLIAPDVVVTAGHCAGSATRVFFGSDVTDSRKGLIVEVKKHVRHPRYSSEGQHHDLTVLLLSRRVSEADPRPLATTKQIDRAEGGRVVGFGRTDATGLFGYGIKRFVDVPVASISCSGSLKGRKDQAAYGCFTGLEIVASKSDQGDSCKGDSGGPFYVETAPDQWRLAAATSRATKGATRQCGDGGIYVRLDKYRDWIEGLPGVRLT